MKLTPNRRMAAFLQSKGHTDVLPLNIWLEQLYLQLFQKMPDYPYCLSLREEEITWERIVTQSIVGQSLLKTTGIARLARDAWVISKQWQIPHNIMDEIGATEDSLVYQDWAREYQSECRRRHWIDSASTLDYLLDAVHKSYLQLPQEIILIGFEELTPQLKTFLNSAQRIGSTIQFLSLGLEQDGQVNRLAAKDSEEELRLAARMANQWAKKTPNCFIGIVVPQLEQQRSLVVRVFEEICLMPFNISAPLSLEHYPLIEAALLALSLLLDEISLEKLSRWLRSPFFEQGISQMVSKAIVDILIREFKAREFYSEELIKRIKHMMSHHAIAKDALWLKNLQKFLEMRAILQEKRSATQWKKTIVNLLSILGWPGERPLNSEEIQIKQQWEKLLEVYAAMESVLGDHYYTEVVLELMRLARITPFLPSSPNASIQILGILEAAGLPFDCLWVTGLHRDAWPLEPAPNPFIPLRVQRSYDLPRSSAARELKVAKRFTERFCNSATQVIFSYPLMIEDRTSTVSPLVEHFPEVSKEFLGICVDQPLMHPQVVWRQQKQDTLAGSVIASVAKQSSANFAERAPAIEAGEKVSGGVNLLKLQALCPFRAFAEIRLRACPLPKIETGLGNKERGEIIHQTLYFFWEGISNQAMLQELPTEELTNKIEIAFEKAIEYWQRRYFVNLSSRYLALEKNRTCDLLHQLMDLEKSRPYFEVVTREEERVIDLQGLQIKIRIDRIDKTLDQEELLIDYKTGEVSISDWFQERPRDPQLPLYCITRDPKPMGIIFSIVRSDGVRFQGLTREEKYLPGVKTVAEVKSTGSEVTFEEQCETWQNTLELLARDFKEGVATVDPVDGENTCRICSLKTLCRVSSKICTS